MGKGEVARLWVHPPITHLARSGVWVGVGDIRGRGMGYAPVDALAALHVIEACKRAGVWYTDGVVEARHQQAGRGIQ